MPSKSKKTLPYIFVHAKSQEGEKKSKYMPKWKWERTMPKNRGVFDPDEFIEDSIEKGSHKQKIRHIPSGGRRTRRKKGGNDVVENLQSNLKDLKLNLDFSKDFFTKGKFKIDDYNISWCTEGKKEKKEKQGGKRRKKRTRRKGGQLNKKTKRKLDTWGIDVNAKGDLTKFEKNVYPEDYHNYTMKDAINAKTAREFKLMMENQIKKKQK